MKLLKIRTLLLLAAVVMATTAAAPVKHQFSAAEQQQISIATPGLFSRSDAFNVDFSLLKASEYSFPLPVGKAIVRKNNSMQIETKDGDAVKAMFDGTVRLSRKHAEMGNVIVIRHRNGFETVYGNNAENLVEVGSIVRAGQTIAIVGHKDGKFYCDFSIMVNGARINPSAMIDVHSHRLRRQTLLCEKSGNYVNVSVLGDKSDIEESATGGKRRHSGVDLKTKPNDEIVAAFDGVVTRSSSYYGYGNCIVLKHANGLETLYSHQSKNFVKVGDKVKAGQVIGLTGRTGRATTEHLHFETHFKGRRFNPNLIFDHTSRQLQQSTITLTKNGGITSKKN